MNLGWSAAKLSLGCAVAQFRMRRISVGTGGASACCSVRPARVQISARHPREVFSTEEEMERNLGDWRRMNVRVLCEFDGTKVRTKISK